MKHYDYLVVGAGLLMPHLHTKQETWEGRIGDGQARSYRG